MKTNEAYKKRKKNKKQVRDEAQNFSNTRNVETETGIRGEKREERKKI